MLELGPGDSELFEVAIATGYSDPLTNCDTGEPGASAAVAPGHTWSSTRGRSPPRPTARCARCAPIRSPKTTGASRSRRSIVSTRLDRRLDPHPRDRLCAAGRRDRRWRGHRHRPCRCGLVVGVVETPLILKLPFTLSRGFEFQSRVWNSSPEEGSSPTPRTWRLPVGHPALLRRDQGLAATENTPSDRWSQPDGLPGDDAVGRRVGDGRLRQHAEAYAAGGSEIAASLWLPAAMTKLAQTPRAVAALDRAQTAVNARMGPIFDAGPSTPLRRGRPAAVAGARERCGDLGRCDAAAVWRSPGGGRRAATPGEEVRGADHLPLPASELVGGSRSSGRC